MVEHREHGRIVRVQRRVLWGGHRVGPLRVKEGGELLRLGKTWGDGIRAQPGGGINQKRARERERERIDGGERRDEEG